MCWGSAASLGGGFLLGEGPTGCEGRGRRRRGCEGSGRRWRPPRGQTGCQRNERGCLLPVKTSRVSARHYLPHMQIRLHPETSTHRTSADIQSTLESPDARVPPGEPDSPPCLLVSALTLSAGDLVVQSLAFGVFTLSVAGFAAENGPSTVLSLSLSARRLRQPEGEMHVLAKLCSASSRLAPAMNSVSMNGQHAFNRVSVGTSAGKQCHRSVSIG